MFHPLLMVTYGDDARAFVHVPGHVPDGNETLARLRGIPDDGVHPGSLYLPHVENGRGQRCRFDEPQGADSPLPDIYLCPFIHGLLPLQDDDAPLVDSATNWGKYRAICRAARQFCLEDQCARHRNWRIDWRYHGCGADANEQSLRGLESSRSS